MYYHGSPYQGLSVLPQQSLDVINRQIEQEIIDNDVLSCKSEYAEFILSRFSPIWEKVESRKRV